MKKYSLIIGLLLCLSISAAEYVGTMRMASGFTLQNVRVNLDDKGNLTLYRVKFARLMPVRLDIVFPGVECRLVNNQMIISGDSIVPTMNDKPRSDRIVTKLHGNADLHSLHFQCLIGDKQMSYEGKTAKND